MDRATAGIVMALAAIAIAIAYFEENDAPVRIISVLVAADLALRQVAEWVGVTQKRFAWALAFGMALLVAILTNAGVHGLGVQLISLTLMGLLWLSLSRGRSGPRRELCEIAATAAH